MLKRIELGFGAVYSIAVVVVAIIIAIHFSFARLHAVPFSFFFYQFNTNTSFSVRKSFFCVLEMFAGDKLPAELCKSIICSIDIYQSIHWMPYKVNAVPFRLQLWSKCMTVPISNVRMLKRTVNFVYQ